MSTCQYCNKEYTFPHGCLEYATFQEQEKKKSIRRDVALQIYCARLNCRYVIDKTYIAAVEGANDFLKLLEET